MYESVILEKTFESSLNYKEIKPVDSKGNQPWIFIGRTEGEVEAPILWPPDVKSQLIRKDPDAGKDWKQEEKGTKEDEMVDGIINSMDMSLSKIQEMVKDREAWHVAVYGVTKSQTWLNDWTTVSLWRSHKVIGRQNDIKHCGSKSLTLICKEGYENWEDQARLSFPLHKAS